MKELHSISPSLEEPYPMSKRVEILLVEDNPNDVELTLHALKHLNLVNLVEVARDGAEALDYIFCRGDYASRNILDGPRLVLMDLKLPKVDGLEVLKQIKADPRLKKIPVVMLTSSKEEHVLVESYRFGVNSYIQKPVDFEQFIDVVRQLGMYWMLINQAPPQ